MTEVVNYAVNDGIAVIILNRPEALNAINNDVRRELPSALDRAAADTNVRCIVVSGAGCKAFCAGADLKEGTFQETPTSFREKRLADRWITSFDRNPKPIIAAIRGVCLGGGLEIALACDLRVAGSDATFGFPETQYGIIPAAGGTQRIAHVVGLGVALDLVLTGRRLSAAEALACQLINRMIDPSSTMDAALELAAKIASRPPTATRLAKEAVRGSVLSNLSVGLARELDLAALLMSVDERAAGLKKFRDRK
jgi:enoyl-CoA hydratase/carnithine racemase